MTPRTPPGGELPLGLQAGAEAAEVPEPRQVRARAPEVTSGPEAVPEPDRTTRSSAAFERATLFASGDGGGRDGAPRRPGADDNGASDAEKRRAETGVHARIGDTVAPVAEPPAAVESEPPAAVESEPPAAPPPEPPDPTGEPAPGTSLTRAHVVSVRRRTPKSATRPVVAHLPASYGGALLADLDTQAEAAASAALARPPTPPSPPASRPPPDVDPDTAPWPPPSPPPRPPERDEGDAIPLLPAAALGLLGVVVAAVVGAGLWAWLHQPATPVEIHPAAAPLAPVTVSPAAPADPAPADPVDDEPPPDEAADDEALADDEPVEEPAPPTRTTTTKKKATAAPAPVEEEDPWAPRAEGTPSEASPPAEDPRKKGLFGKKKE